MTRMVASGTARSGGSSDRVMGGLPPERWWFTQVRDTMVWLLLSPRCACTHVHSHRKRVGPDGGALPRPRLLIALCMEGTLANAIDHRHTVLPRKKGPRPPIPHPGPLVLRLWPHAA